MKLLILGDGGSLFIKNFGVALKELDSNISIDIVNIHPISNRNLKENLTGICDTIYNEHPLLGIIEKIPKVRGIVHLFYPINLLKKVRNRIHIYDVILLQGFWIRNCEILQKLSAEKIFKVGAFWGSDFYKRGKKEKIIFNTLNACDCVIVSTNEMIQNVLSVKNIRKEKIRKCLFGLEPLKILFENPDINNTDVKRILGLNDNNFTITCGYNGTENQQHLSIIRSIAQIKNQLPENYKVLLPMTYGTENRFYQKEVKEFLLKEEIDFVIYKDFMSAEKTAFLRKATDIFIQIQKTDAFSGSMREHLLAQSVVITGSWLPYQSLIEKDIYYETIDEIEQLSEKLLNVLKNYDKVKHLVKLKNTPEKFKDSLWTECIKGWHKALYQYDSINNKNKICFQKK